MIRIDPQDTRLDRLGELMEPHQREHRDRLGAFREQVMSGPDDFRERLGARVEQMRAGLGCAEQQALAVLESYPDYLGPLGFIREETLNTRFLAWLLGDATRTDLRLGPASAIWSMLRRQWGSRQRHAVDSRRPRFNDASFLEGKLRPELLAHSSATAECDLGPYGRIDVRWQPAWEGLERLDVLIEAKVDAAAGPEQLPDYRHWLVEKRNENGVLVFLDKASRWRDEAGGTSPVLGLHESGALHVHWKDILIALMPLVARGESVAHTMLRAWLKSLAVLEGLTPDGPREHWTLLDRLKALQGAKQLAAGWEGQAEWRDQ